MQSRTILKGENLILKRPLLSVDGVTPLPLTSVTGLTLQFRSGSKVHPTIYTLGTSPELRADGLNAVEFEITSAISLTLPSGPLTEIWTINTNNTAFVVDSLTRKDIVEVTELAVK